MVRTDEFLGRPKLEHPLWRHHHVGILFHERANFLTAGVEKAALQSATRIGMEHQDELRAVARRQRGETLKFREHVGLLVVSVECFTIVLYRNAARAAGLTPIFDVLLPGKPPIV